MKRFFRFLLPIIVVLAILYPFRSLVGEKFLPFWYSIENNLKSIFAGAPCEEPIPYVLGRFDTKFNISQKYFLDALADAEAIWEEPSGLDLFNYTPGDKSRDVLKINLIYDYRQQATSKLAGLGIVVQNTRASYDTLKVRFLALKAEYEKEKNEFEKKVSAFNRSTRTNKDEYEVLQSMQNDLEKKADEINSMVVVLNRLAAILNLSVENYNNVSTARGESFEEGVYFTDGMNQEIDIYEFSNKTKLVRVLAHELGHALGLEHVDDSKAIMYKLNQGNSQTLTTADISALKAICRE